MENENKQDVNLQHGSTKLMLAEVMKLRDKLNGDINKLSYELDKIHHKILFVQKLECDFELNYLRKRQDIIKEQKWTLEEYRQLLNQDVFNS